MKPFNEIDGNDQIASAVQIERVDVLDNCCLLCAVLMSGPCWYIYQYLILTPSPWSMQMLLECIVTVDVDVHLIHSLLWWDIVAELWSSNSFSDSDVDCNVDAMHELADSNLAQWPWMTSMSSTLSSLRASTSRSLITTWAPSLAIQCHQVSEEHLVKAVDKAPYKGKCTRHLRQHLTHNTSHRSC